MDFGDVIIILVALLIMLVIWLRHFAAINRPPKPKRRKHCRRIVDKADMTDMYGNWMYPDLHREKEDQELRKWLNDFMR